MGESSNHFKILSLDGGGTWALVQVHALKKLFGADASGHDVLERFDLAVANSGGSIVLACLAANMQLERIRLFFETEAERTDVFDAKWALHVRRALPVPRYSTQSKRAGLVKHLGDFGAKRLREWDALRLREHERRLSHLLIIGFDYDTQRAAFFRTNLASRAATSSVSSLSDFTFVDAVHASTNAPVAYFDEPTVAGEGEDRRRYWDGAVGGYNNPALAGIVEAIANGIPHDAVRVLSIGTGTVRRPRRPAGIAMDDIRFEGGQTPCQIGDLKKLASAILEDPPDAASFIAHVMLGGRLPDSGKIVADGPVVRMCPVIRPEVQADGTWAVAVPDGFGYDEWQKLNVLDMDAVEDSDVKLISKLAGKWLEGQAPNQPIRAGWDLRAEIGHDSFSGAKTEADRWL